MPEQSRILQEVYETANDLYSAGVMDKRRLQDYEAFYQALQVPKYTSEDIKALRSRLKVSQSVLALYINTSAATVRAWEAGKKKPGGPSCKLLDILNRKGLEAIL